MRVIFLAVVSAKQADPQAQVCVSRGVTFSRLEIRFGDLVGMVVVGFCGLADGSWEKFV